MQVLQIGTEARFDGDRKTGPAAGIEHTAVAVEFYRAILQIERTGKRLAETIVARLILKAAT